MSCVRDGGQGTQPVTPHDPCPSNRYLFSYCATYYDVNEDDGVRRNYRGGGSAQLTFSSESFPGLQGALGALC